VVGWTTVGSATEVTRTDLSLQDNKTYYFAVQSGNGYGAWSSSTNSNGIKTPTTSVSVQAAKALPDSSLPADTKAIRGKVVSASFSASGYLYIQEPDKPFGLKALCSASPFPVVGSVVDLAGLMKGAGAERYLDCTGNAIGVASGSSPCPVAIVNSSIGGVSLNAYTPGVAGGLGANNIGLLVLAYGTVTQRRTTDPKYFYIDDGCGLRDGTTTGAEENVGVRVVADPASYPAGTYMVVRGISSCFENGGVLLRQVLPRAGEIVALGP